MTLQQALRAAVLQLQAAGFEDASRDARRLLAAAMVWDMHKLTLEGQAQVPPDAQVRFDAMIAKRIDFVPVSQIIGGRLFFGRWFTVTRDVLDPRPDTETLIEIALDEPFTKVLDLGTGSGAIVITLLSERPEAQGVGTDLSADALDVAASNAVHLVDRITLVASDWFASVEGEFDLIVSNPPYIALGEMDDLQPEVRLHEPRMALTDEADGLMAYRQITQDAPAHLTPGGRLIFEIGPTQAVAVVDLMVAAGFERIRVVPDLDGRDRVVVGYKPAIAA